MFPGFTNVAVMTDDFIVSARLRGERGNLAIGEISVREWNGDCGARTICDRIEHNVTIFAIVSIM